MDITTTRHRKHIHPHSHPPHSHTLTRSTARSPNRGPTSNETKPMNRDRRNNIGAKKILLLNFLKILSLSFFSPSAAFSPRTHWMGGCVSSVRVRRARKKQKITRRNGNVSVLLTRRRDDGAAFSARQYYVISRLSTLQIWISFVSTRETSLLVLGVVR